MRPPPQGVRVGLIVGVSAMVTATILRVGWIILVHSPSSPLWGLVSAFTGIGVGLIVADHLEEF